LVSDKLIKTVRSAVFSNASEKAFSGFDGDFLVADLPPKRGVLEFKIFL